MKLRTTFLTTTLFCSAVGVSFAQPPGGPGGPGRGGMLRNLPLMAALDADEDGEISGAEIEQAAAKLKTLDKNGDGKLTADELRPAGRGFGGGPGGPGGGFGPGPGGFGGTPPGGPGGFGGGPPGGGPGGPGGGRGPALSPEQTVARFLERDENKDGKLSKEELGSRLQGLLTRADKDKDGFATKEELTRLAESEVAGQRGGPGGGFGGGPGGPGGGPGFDGAPRGFGGPPGFGGGPPGGPGAFLDRLFELDADKDGKLTREELSSLTNGPGGPRRGPPGDAGRPQRVDGPEQ